MSNVQDLNNLENMLELAKFGADRHNERRQLEFRIFISYITVLALLFYHTVKPKDPILQGQDDIGSSVLLIVFLLIIHFFYLSWKRNFFIASINDVRRRDFYLLKVQCISYHLSQNLNLTFRPSRTKKVSLNMGGGESCEIYEWCLFKIRQPKFIKKPSWSELKKLRGDTHIWFQIVVPTLMLFGFIVVIFKRYLSLQIIVPILLLIIMVIATLCEYQSLIFREKGKGT